MALKLPIKTFSANPSKAKPRFLLVRVIRIVKGCQVLARGRIKKSF
jgi:hypothetical protein